MSTTIPPRNPGRHGWADLLRLVYGVRALAYDQSLAPDDAMRRIRDRFVECDETRIRRELRAHDYLAPTPTGRRRRPGAQRGPNVDELIAQNDSGSAGPDARHARHAAQRRQSDPEDRRARFRMVDDGRS